MIIAVNFGGLAIPQSKAQTLVAPMPLEYVKPQTIEVIKNHTPRPQ